MRLQLPPRWREAVNAGDLALLAQLARWIPHGRFATFEWGWWPLVPDPHARPEDDSVPFAGAFVLELAGGGRAELAVLEREAFSFIGAGAPEARARAVLDAWLGGAGLVAAPGPVRWADVCLEGLPRDGSWCVRSLEIDQRLAQLLSDRLGAVFLCLPRALAEP